MIVVLLVRHADIDLPPASDDPPLNAAGRERAKALDRALAGAGIATVFVSSLARTRQTVEPLAARLGLQPQETPTPREFAAKLLSGTAGGVVLVAGHSNTVPAMIAVLGAPPPAIGERDFDNLFVVSRSSSGQEASLVRLKYGK